MWHATVCQCKTTTAKQNNNNKTHHRPSFSLLFGVFSDGGLHPQRKRNLKSTLFRCLFLNSNLLLGTYLPSGMWNRIRPPVQRIPRLLCDQLYIHTFVTAWSLHQESACCLSVTIQTNRNTDSIYHQLLKKTIVYFFPKHDDTTNDCKFNTVAQLIRGESQVQNLYKHSDCTLLVYWWEESSEITFNFWHWKCINSCVWTWLEQWRCRQKEIKNKNQGDTKHKPDEVQTK